MFGLKENTDLSFLNEKELIQVGIGFNDLVLYFEENIHISITSECEFEDQLSQNENIDDYKKSANLICSLLGSTICNVIGGINGTLELGFSNGCKLKICDDSEHYESYLIKSPFIQIIV